MNKKVTLLAGVLTFVSSAYAGGLLTNTNQSLAFNRNFALEGAIGIGGVYANPAGVAFLGQGFHLSLNIQNVYQTRTITSGITIPGLQGTSFYQPFKLNGGDENGNKFYKGKASVPILPSVLAAYNKGPWSFQFGFGLVGGGGKATFNDGLASFERLVSLTPALLQQNGFTSATPGYSVDQFMRGQQYDFGFQFGAAYKINEHWAVYGGFRFNYIWNKYEGHITNISANINGTNQNLYQYLGAQADAAKEAANTYSQRALAETNPAIKAQYEAAAQQYQAGFEKASASREIFKDKYLDCTQRGWGITPIIGVDFKTGKWNFGAKYEFTTKFNIENDTKRDDTGLFKNGVNTPNDLPGILAVGAQYEAAKNVRIMASYHYYFDKDARMDKDKQKLLSGNTKEYLAGVEWDITPAITISGGGQFTRYGLGDGKYLSDMSFVTSSYSLGVGAKVKVAKNAHLNIAYFFTDYEHFKKESEQTISVSGQQIQAQNYDDFTRTNKVFGVGLDIDF